VAWMQCGAVQRSVAAQIVPLARGLPLPTHRARPMRGHGAQAYTTTTRAQVCSDGSLLLPLGLALPYAWRLVQCLRVWADTGARPQLWNAIKYSTAFPVSAVARRGQG
jgi:hypothetical protein